MRIPQTDLTIPDPLHQCPLCNKGYWNLGSLSNHIKFKHPEHFNTKVKL